MQHGPAVCIKTSSCWASIIKCCTCCSSCSGCILQRWIATNSKCSSFWDKWTKVTRISDCTSFSAISISAHCEGNHPPLRQWVRMNLEGTCVMGERVALSSELIHGAKPRQATLKHALSLQPYPVQTASFLCQTARGQKGWGTATVGLCNNTRFKDTSVYTSFFSHAIVIVILLLWAWVKICWCENKVFKQSGVFFFCLGILLIP